MPTIADLATDESFGPLAAASFQKVEIEKWRPIIKAAGIGVRAQ